MSIAKAKKTLSAKPGAVAEGAEEGGAAPVATPVASGDLKVQSSCVIFLDVLHVFSYTLLVVSCKSATDYKIITM